jgi:hypothetical protein
VRGNDGVIHFNKGNTAQCTASALNARPLAYFPSYFTEMLGNTSSLACAFCFIWRKI